MLVETFSRIPGKTGLHVGGGNVQRFFPESICDIELHLGHLKILCTLHPDFWRGKPEIFDERLSDWLESKYLHGKRERTSIHLAMAPIGTNTFRLRPVSLDEQGIRSGPAEHSIENVVGEVNRVADWSASAPPPVQFPTARREAGMRR
jgi:hypothetical protein